MMLENTLAPCPILTFFPMFTEQGMPGGSDPSAVSTAPSPMLEKFPMRTAFTSPWMTALYHILTCEPTSTSPSSEAFGATQASWMIGCFS